VGRVHTHHGTSIRRRAVVPKVPNGRCYCSQMLWGRVYFAVQAAAGAAWWVAVALSPAVRTATLGSLDAVAVASADIPLFVITSAVAALGVRVGARIATGWTSLVAVALAVYATVTTEAGWGVLAMCAATAGSVAALLLVERGRLPTEWIIAGPFSFRPARVRAGNGANLAATLGQIVVFWGFFLGIVPVVLALLERRWELGVALPWPAVGVGAVILVLASAAGLSSAYTMSTRGGGTPLPVAMPNRLVVAGAYRWIRNPMATASIVQGVAVGMMLSSWLVVVYAVAGALLWNYAVRPHEEADLEERFGEEYRSYRDAVRCWIPRSPATAR
jgi:protein-S-isoprenylcysteine O-methyltransferase Ste14